MEREHPVIPSQTTDRTTTANTWTSVASARRATTDCAMARRRDGDTERGATTTARTTATTGGTRARLHRTRLKVARVEQPDRDGEVDEDGRADLSSMTWRITIWSLNHEDVTVGDNPEVDR